MKRDAEDGSISLPTSSGHATGDLRHKTQQPLPVQLANFSLEAAKTGVLPTFAAICSKLHLGSFKLSDAWNPCASSIG